MIQVVLEVAEHNVEQEATRVDHPHSSLFLTTGHLFICPPTELWPLLWTGSLIWTMLTLAQCVESLVCYLRAWWAHLCTGTGGTKWLRAESGGASRSCSCECHAWLCEVGSPVHCDWARRSSNLPLCEVGSLVHCDLGNKVNATHRSVKSAHL